MDKVINVTVRNKIAENAGLVEYVCGNSDFVVKFDFDDEWNEFNNKTARFTYGREYVDVVFGGDECAVPVISNVRIFGIGVFAGNLKTTTPAYVNAKKSILCGVGSPAAPSDDVYNQLMELLENLVDRVEALEQGGVSDATTAELGAAILGKLKLR